MKKIHRRGKKNGSALGLGKIPYTQYPKYKLLRMDFFKNYKHLFIFFSAKDTAKTLRTRCRVEELFTNCASDKRFI